MARRTVVVKLSYAIIIDDDREGLPYIRSPADFAMLGVKGANVPGLTEIKDVKLSMSLDRESSRELRRRDRIVRANQRQE